MSILKAYTLPHPPLAVPSVGGGKESKGIPKTLAAMNEVAAEIAELKPETIIFITPHSTVYADYFHISPGDEAHGDLGRFGAGDEKFNTKYDEELVKEIERIAKFNDIHAGTQGEREKSLDHGVTVPMWYINQKYTDYKSIRISQSAMAPTEHYMMGQVIAKAVEATKRKAIIIASSDLSHKLKEDAPYGFSPEGPKFDALVIDALEKGDFLSLFLIPDKLRGQAGECGYNSLMIMAGCFDKQGVDSKLMSYEGPFGVGYAVASFMATGKNENRNVLEQYVEHALEESGRIRNMEDSYQELARRSLEHIIETGEMLPVPNGLDDELIKKQAGVFVSINKNGKLRGCVGTTAPTTKSIASEIIQNAVSAGLSDSRFDPVSAPELPYLVYKVDVLSAPEKIAGPEQLDEKRYGVIVSSGSRRGLLLPNLDGIDSIEAQIAIAKSKAGISETEPVELERFEVVRHG